ncbi:hypothetical protein DPMN_066945 [Dreissena polymorpha]|uniref:Uncharacterized protein n=1 Tax=Dreissena polymorpha TaxID=45954 RepID=A0A9D4BKZ1_DREPO|nr:hypothetical protein DPMN_066945 [Dreissena polymorpha]
MRILSGPLHPIARNNETTLSFNADKPMQQTLCALSRLGQMLNKVNQSKAAKSTNKNTVSRRDKPNPCRTVSIQYFRTSSVMSMICDPNQVMRVKSTGSKIYSVREQNDLQICLISSICEKVTGELLITDINNSKVKIFYKNFNVVAPCDLPTAPVSMCSTNSSKVAVALNNNEVHFIRVTNGQLVKDRIL